MITFEQVKGNAAIRAYMEKGNGNLGVLGFTEHGAAHAMMSGSGPSVFGVFQTTEDAVRSCEQLRAVGAAAFVCHPCGKYQL